MTIGLIVTFALVLLLAVLASVVLQAVRIERRILDQLAQRGPLTVQQLAGMGITSAERVETVLQDLVGACEVAGPDEMGRYQLTAGAEPQRDGWTLAPVDGCDCTEPANSPPVLRMLHESDLTAICAATKCERMHPIVPPSAPAAALVEPGERDECWGEFHTMITPVGWSCCRQCGGTWKRTPLVSVRTPAPPAPADPCAAPAAGGEALREFEERVRTHVRVEMLARLGVETQENVAGWAALVDEARAALSRSTQGDGGRNG